MSDQAQTTIDPPPDGGALAVAPAPPRAGAEVHRAALIRRLCSERVPLAVLVAPAGYGKTALLDQWVLADERPVARVRASSRDADAAHLLATLARALDGVRALPRRVLRRVTARDVTGGDGPWADVEQALSDPYRPVVVAIDDADHLRGTAARAILTDLLHALGPGSTLALATRAEPALPVARLRAADAVLELRLGDLRFSARDAAQVLASTGVALTPDAIARLVAWTAGWPAAMRLAATILRDAEDPHVDAQALTGAHEVIADYVRDELLAGLRPGDLDFLTRTAPLDELTGPACDALLGSSGSGARLRALARDGMPLESQDRLAERYRLVRVVGDVLRADLHREDPARERAVHRRAGAWYERRDVDAAIAHASAARDLHRVERVVWDAVPRAVWQGRSRQAAEWLARVDEDVVRSRPALAAATALTLLVARRDDAERWTEIACRRAGQGRRAAPADLLAATAALRAGAARDGLAAMRAEAERAVELASPAGPWRVLACWLAGSAAQLQGDRDSGTARLEQAAREATELPVLRVLAMAQLALAALQGDDADGPVLADAARAELDRCGLAEEPACALVLAVCALAGAERGRVDDARGAIGAARRCAESLEEAPAWYDATLRIALARAELRLSDAAAARCLLADAARAVRHLPERGVLAAWIDDGWARADAFAAGAVGTPSALTTAELRVLRFLPSHLSFREIGVRLHVSANTVKTQAHAVYRKLDASSRSEAVARARAVGLVED